MTEKEEKAVAIARRLHDDFWSWKRFFRDYRMPEYIVPGNPVEGSKEHACYLIFVISIDYVTDAVLKYTSNISFISLLLGSNF